MAIPRNINGINPAKVVKNGATMQDHQNILLQSDDIDNFDTSLAEDDALPDFEDAFDDDEKIAFENKAEVSEEVKNLDKAELDKLLGLDEDFEALDDIQQISSEDENEDDKEIENFIFDFNDENDQDEITDNSRVEETEEAYNNELSAEIHIDEENDEPIIVQEWDDEESASISEDSILDEAIPDNEEDSDDDEVDFETLMSRMNALMDDDNEEENSDEESEINIVDNLDDSVSEDNSIQENNFSFESEDEEDEEDSIIFINDDEDLDNDANENTLEEKSDLFFDDEDDNDEEDEEENIDWSFDTIDDEFENDEESTFDPKDETADDNLPEEEEPEFSIPVLSKKKKSEPLDETTDPDDVSKSSPKPEKNKDKGSGNALLNRLKLIKEQIMADIKGEEIPQSLPEDVEDEPTEKDKDKNKNPDERKKKGNTKAGKNPFKNLNNLKIFKIFSPFKKAYLFIVKLCFSLLNFVLGILSKIPFIGKFVKPLLSASKALQKIATYMPIVLLLLGLVMVSFMSVPRSYTNDELPDNGAISIHEIKYNGGMTSAKIENTGDVILSDITINVKVYSLQPSINPKTWIIPVMSKECSSEPISIDIESEQEITVNCSSTAGYIPRATAELA